MILKLYHPKPVHQFVRVHALEYSVKNRKKSGINRLSIIYEVLAALLSPDIVECPWNLNNLASRGVDQPFLTIPAGNGGLFYES